MMKEKTAVSSPLHRAGGLPSLVKRGETRTTGVSLLDPLRCSPTQARGPPPAGGGCPVGRPGLVRSSTGVPRRNGWRLDVTGSGMKHGEGGSSSSRGRRGAQRRRGRPRVAGGEAGRELAVVVAALLVTVGEAPWGACRRPGPLAWIEDG
jgi:hypothetical protein